MLVALSIAVMLIAIVMMLSPEAGRVDHGTADFLGANPNQNSSVS